jgi:hypothetical protein
VLLQLLVVEVVMVVWVLVAAVVVVDSLELQ